MVPFAAALVCVLKVEVKYNKIMFKRTRSLSNAICNTRKIFLSEYSWMTYKFTVTWSHNSMCISSHIEDNGYQYIGVITSTCQGHVTLSRDVSCHVTIWFPGAISYRCSIVTESLSPTIFEIIGIFHIWVTTLTFLGHVTSSVTWQSIRHMSFPIGVPL